VIRAFGTQAGKSRGVKPERARAGRRQEGSAQRREGRGRPRVAPVDNLIRIIPESGVEALPVAVRAAGFSRRTLQRRLTEAGPSFSQLRDEARLITAAGLIETDVKLSEIAVKLGYSDPAHFTRAFKEWTSVSPAEYRRVRRLERSVPVLAT